MSNPQKIEFQIGGKTYNYLLGTYGLAKLEQRQGKPWPLVMEEAGKSGFGVDITLALFHCGLLLYHEPMTEKEASILLDELGVQTFSERFAEAWRLQMGADEARPTMAATTTGGNGISTPFLPSG